MAVKVRLLQANHGDCILVTHEDNQGVFNLLIDGGNAATFKYGPRRRYDGHLCKILDEIKAKKQFIDLVILTHIDDDHIGGLIKAFETPGYLSELTKSIWFNSSRLITDYFRSQEIPENNVILSNSGYETSVKQGKELESLLDEIGCERYDLIQAGQVIDKGPFKFTILSPSEENLKKLLCIWPEEKHSPETSDAETDYESTFQELLTQDIFEEDETIANGSSIAFIAEIEGKKMLFLGDAHNKTICESLQTLNYSTDSKLKVEFVKVSHHGSKYNTSCMLLEMIETNHYLISTNGNYHGLPDKRTIARILSTNPTGIISFNYGHRINKILLDNEVEAYSERLQEIVEEINL